MFLTALIGGPRSPLRGILPIAITTPAARGAHGPPGAISEFNCNVPV